MEMERCLCIWGAMAVIGAAAPMNLVHVIINNEAHETVGGMPTVASTVKFTKLAEACGYPYAVCVDTLEDLDYELTKAKKMSAAEVDRS